LRLASADRDSARMLAAEVGRGASVAADNRDALLDVDTVILALRFTVLKSVIDEIALSLTDKLVIVPSNPLRTDDQGNVLRVLPEGQSSGKAVTEWLPVGVPFAMAFGSMSADLLKASSNRTPEPVVLFYATDDDRAATGVERLIRMAGFEPLKVGGSEQSTRLEVGGDLHDVVVGLAEVQSLVEGA
jgi:predicted dinucleotide-binding enzyme